ncbi:MAG: autotransporter outer membrane beta-barrel domain-containing protein, partial [Parvibaculaceae bacterium]
GIHAINYGCGILVITADGVVTGYDEDGIHAYNSEDSDNLRIETGADSTITGYTNGINAGNFGSGNLVITADGQVTGHDDGIDAYNSENGANLRIETGADSTVTGYTNGIIAGNFGYGNLVITANGEVTGEDEDGIFAYNGGPGSGLLGNGIDLRIETGAQSVITGQGGDGIDAENYGSGILTITARGTVLGDNNGIEATNSYYGGALRIETGVGSVVTGEGGDGIDAEQFGSGNLRITANGEVTGLENSGITAQNWGYGRTIIEVGAAGLVQGNEAGIFAQSYGDQNVSITNYGLVRNLSGASDDLAIEFVLVGGRAVIANYGNLVGYVNIDSDDPGNDRLGNSGTWNTAGGTNEFGDGNDLVANSGLLIAADDGSSNETTRFSGVETFHNSGRVTMADGAEGDELRLGGSLSPDTPTDYEGKDGTLLVDAALGPQSAGGLSDQLFVGGNTSGTTRVFVNVTDALGADTEGLPVVLVGGASADGQFVLGAPVNAGFFTWDMRYDAAENWHELFTSGVGIGSYEFAAGISGAQEIWHQTTGTLLQRQADLRALLEGLGVTPVADYAEPVAPTPAGKVTPGFWLKAVGAYVDRDDEEDGFTLDRKQTIWGGMAGFDFGDQYGGSAWLFGLFAGYLNSDLDFDATDTRWTYEGPTVGAYATYLNGAFHADLTVKADFLDIDIDPQDLAPGSDDADTDAFNAGGRLDLGYKFGESLFIEPQATLAVVHTEIDDVDIFGGSVEFDDETSVRGRLGLRLGHEQTGSNGVIYSGDVTASVWEDFSGDNDVTIVDTGVPAFGASDDPGQTYGDIALGFSAADPEGWSGFLRANYLFGTDYEAVTGNAGVRYAW